MIVHDLCADVFGTRIVQLLERNEAEVAEQVKPYSRPRHFPYCWLLLNA